MTVTVNPRTGKPRSASMTATDTHWTDVLPKNACRGAVVWARTQPSLAVAWATCKRADWMLWLAVRLSGPPESDSHRKAVVAACACARKALKHVPEGETRPQQVIDMAERWANGESGVTLDDVRSAYAAAAHAYAAFVIAAAATDAALATAATATATDATTAADAAAQAAADEDLLHLEQLADVVRERLPAPPVAQEAFA